MLRPYIQPLERDLLYMLQLKKYFAYSYFASPKLNC